MLTDWQNIVVLAAVAIAAAYVASRAWAMVRQRGKGCGSGGCNTCSQNEQGLGQERKLPLVELKPPAGEVESGKP